MQAWSQLWWRPLRIRETLMERADGFRGVARAPVGKVKRREQLLILISGGIG
jgi:hypothetical protein